jgi:murein L,D-transpeptidase YcbB/YkuD
LPGGQLAAVVAALLVIAPVAACADPAPGSPAPAPRVLSNDDAAAIVHALAEAPAQGLPRIDVGPALAALQSADPAQRANAVTQLEAAAVALARAERGQSVDPGSIDRDFALAPAYDAVADFAQARDGGRIQAWLDGLAPRSADYWNLVKARAPYAAAVASGGWPAIGAGKPPKVGAADHRSPALRVRLAAEGYVAAPPADPKIYDPALAQALAAFQTAHGLEASGRLTEETLAALNVPAADRLAVIDANLVRARWLPAQPPGDRIEVDTGDPQATLFQAGKPTLTMRTVVGRPHKRTPTFAAAVTAVQYNPPWMVPPDIAARELYPKGRGYLARHGFHTSGGRLIQRPGPRSALGYVKFVVEDPFAVYLHDTPERLLFARDARWLSHGCVRVANPRDLAAALLASQGWTRAAVDAAIETRSTTTTPLTVGMPLYIVYRTALADGDGHVTFRSDVYGWDDELAHAMARASG